LHINLEPLGTALKPRGCGAAADGPLTIEVSSTSSEGQAFNAGFYAAT
jgi:hypothetical protein